MSDLRQGKDGKSYWEPVYGRKYALFTSQPKRFGGKGTYGPHAPLEAWYFGKKINTEMPYHIFFRVHGNHVLRYIAYPDDPAEFITVSGKNPLEPMISAEWRGKLLGPEKEYVRQVITTREEQLRLEEMVAAEDDSGN